MLLQGRIKTGTVRVLVTLADNAAKQFFCCNLRICVQCETRTVPLWLDADCTYIRDEADPVQMVAELRVVERDQMREFGQVL